MKTLLIAVLAGSVACASDPASSPADIPVEAAPADSATGPDTSDGSTRSDSSDAADAADSEDTADTGPDADATDLGGGDAGPDAAWDPEPAAFPCAADESAPLLDQALDHAGLTRASFAFTDADYQASGYFTGGWLDDPFLLEWFRPVQADPARAACFANDRAATLDESAAGPHPVAATIRRAAALLGRWEDGPPVAPGVPEDAVDDLLAAMAACCQAAGKSCDLSAPDLLADIPEALQADLAPIFWAMADATRAHVAMAATGTFANPGDWVAAGNPGVLTAGASVDVTDARVLEYLLGADTRPALNLAAARVAYAVESVDWSAWRGQVGIVADIWTPLGWIRIRDASDDTYAGSATRLWFFLDLGGDDVHEDPVGATTHVDQAVTLAIDLDGADTYSYAEVASPGDGEGLLPSDAAGRYGGDENYGPITLSTRGRQGSAAHGVAMLFDLGPQGDTYRSLAMSQGYGHLGVGVLYDAGGDDEYRSEIASQGAAGYGIGLLLDAGGHDRYEAFNNAQGFGFVGGAGILHDADGDDVYFADHGDPGSGGHPIYFSPQMAHQANSSFVQGAGFGMRRDASSTFLSGGIGILRDARGDDQYTAGVFAQGTGYWQGTGILSDGDGADSYDAFYYVQGGAAHYAMGLLLDAGDGADRMNQTLSTRYMEVGAGHDYSLGLLVNEGGDDTYSFGGLALGASNCNGIGLFVDNGGDDTYVTASDHNTGLGNVSGECLGTRPTAVSIGIMIDAGGTDTYDYPESLFPLPADGATFGHVAHDLPSEHGAGVDGEGESGIHAR